MYAVLKGNQTGGNWSDPTAWADGKVPVSSDYLDIQLDASSNENLGTAQNSFVANDVIGAASGLSYPELSVVGFLHANTVQNLSEVFVSNGYLQAQDIRNVADLEARNDSGVSNGGSVYVTNDLVNVNGIVAEDGGVLHVGRDLINVNQVNLGFGSKIEIGRSVGNTDFVMGIEGATLILDKPNRGSFTNTISIGSGDGAENIELGCVAFDHADFIPNTPGSLTGKIQLTNHGVMVYQLTNVVEAAPVGSLSVGFDKNTGYDFVSYHA